MVAMAAGAMGLVAGMPLPGAASAGTVFREVQVVEQGAPAASVRLVRQVLSQGENCKILHEESTDPLAPAGSYILATNNDAFIVDPAHATVTPVDATDMLPVGQSADERPQRLVVSNVSLEQQFEGAGPALLGLPTRHYVYRLRYQLQRPGAGSSEPARVRHDELHDFFATPWPEDLQIPAIWRNWRAAEDAGVGPERRELRDAVDELQERGFFLKQTIERRASGAAAGEGAAIERVSREVTALSRQDMRAEVFLKPEGFSPAEFLAPVPDDAAEAATQQQPAGPGKPAGDDPPRQE